MPVYDDYLRARADEANRARGDAERRLVARLANGDPIDAGLIMAVMTARAVAEWWTEAVDMIDHEGLDAADVLARTRTAARRTLTDYPIPRHACPIEQEFARARIEAARAFYRATAHLDEITVTATARAARADVPGRTS